MAEDTEVWHWHKGPAQDPLAEEFDDMRERDLRRGTGIHRSGVAGAQGEEETPDPETRGPASRPPRG
jgi:hypothetical protein